MLLWYASIICCFLFIDIETYGYMCWRYSCLKGWQTTLERSSKCLWWWWSFDQNTWRQNVTAMAATLFIIPNACGWLIDHIFYDRMAFNDACHDRLITDLSDWSLSIQWCVWCVSMGSSYKLPKGSFITSWCLTVFVYVTNHYML